MCAIKQKINSSTHDDSSDDLIIEIVCEDVGEIACITIKVEAERENQEKSKLMRLSMII